MPNDRPADPTRPASAEPVALADAAVLVVVAAALRLWAFGRLGLSHFDEGGYAMSAQAIATGSLPAGLYPLQHFLAPPLFFGTAGLAMRLLGRATDGVLLGTSAAAGILAVPLVYAATRLWFGRAAGMTAALALALSDYHVLLSRAALTDSAFVTLFVAALALFGLAETRRSVGLAALAGLATGMAWNTKYHGWLAGVVATVAILPVALREGRGAVRASVTRLAVAGLVAAAAYAPWFLWVQAQEGGYARLAAEHARFLRPSRAPWQALTQIRHQEALDGWPGRVSPALALAWITVAAGRRADVKRRFTLAGWVGVLLLAGVAAGQSVVLGLLALAGAGLVLRRWRSAGIGPSLAIAFFVVFSVLTPLYRPYPRLLLPWFVAATVLAGVALDTIARRPPGPAVAGPLAVAAGLLLAWSGLREPLATSAPTDGLRIATQAVLPLASASEPLAVIGEPAVVFYLRGAGRTAWHLDQPADLRRYLAAGSTVWLIGGRYSRRIRGPASLEAWLQAHPGDAQEVARIPVTRINELRLLDDMGWSDARRFRRGEAPGTYELVVYRARWRGL